MATMARANVILHESSHAQTVLRHTHLQHKPRLIFRQWLLCLACWIARMSLRSRTNVRHEQTHKQQENATHISFFVFLCTREKVAASRGAELIVLARSEPGIAIVGANRHSIQLSKAKASEKLSMGMRIRIKLTSHELASGWSLPSGYRRK